MPVVGVPRVCAEYSVVIHGNRGGRNSKPPGVYGSVIHNSERNVIENRRSRMARYPAWRRRAVTPTSHTEGTQVGNRTKRGKERRNIARMSASC